MMYLGDKPVKAIARSNNLLNIFGRTKGAYKAFSNTTVRDYLTDKEYYIGLSRVNYENPNDISVEFNADGFTVRNGGSGYGVAFPVECKANTAYTLSFNAISDKDAFECGIGFYNAEGQWLSHTYNPKNATISKFTTPENCTLMTLCFYNYSPSTISAFTHIMLNEGSTTLPYEPYNQLFTVPIKKIMRTTNTVTFDGTENWINAVTTAGFYFYTTVNERALPNTDFTTNDDTVLRTGVAGSNPSYSYVRFYVDEALYPSVEDWKAHLVELVSAGNPLTITYQLETPTVEGYEY